MCVCSNERKEWSERQSKETRQTKRKIIEVYIERMRNGKRYRMRENEREREAEIEIRGEKETERHGEKERQIQREKEI